MASPIQEHNWTLARLKKFGVADKDVVQLLPQSLAGGWKLYQEVLPDGNTVVEYRHASGIPHEVSFVATDPQHARAMLLLWLKENRKA